MKRIGKLLPIDGFIVMIHDTPSINYVQSLTHLYQPLIGIHAVSLYQTLFNESNDQQTNPQTHHTLMNYLQIPLPDLYEARLKLEGIGLLKTFQQSTSDQTIYTYELQKPFTPKEFFNDAMLSQLLYHHIGDMKYSLLKQEYTHLIKSCGEEITASFGDVFQTFQPIFEHHNQSQIGLKENNQFVESLDFSWLEVMLKQRMIRVKDVLTTQNKKIISELATLYDLATYEIEKAVLWALTDENKLDTEELKNACHDLFKTKGQQRPIQLTVKQEQEHKPANDLQKPKSREEQLILQFETMSPKQLLEDLSSGKQASEREMRMIRDVMLSQGLPAPVMNVLVHYVLIQSNMKLSKAYLETIASHWSRANLSSAKEAMDFAKTEIEKFKTRQPRSKQRSSEIIPDWFKDRKKQQKHVKKSSQTTPEQVDYENEKEEIMKLLQKHSNRDNNNHVQG